MRQQRCQMSLAQHRPKRWLPRPHNHNSIGRAYHRPVFPVCCHARRHRSAGKFTANLEYLAPSVDQPPMTCPGGGMVPVVPSTSAVLSEGLRGLPRAHSVVVCY